MLAYTALTGTAAYTLYKQRQQFFSSEVPSADASFKEVEIDFVGDLKEGEMRAL